MSHAIEPASRRVFAKSIYHPTDFSPASHLAFVHGLAIALVDQSRLDILHSDVKGEGGRQRLPRVRETLIAWGLLESGSDRSAVYRELAVAIRKFRTRGDPVKRSLEHIASAGADLVVLGTKKRHGLARWLRPSKAVALVRHLRGMSLVVPENCRGFVSSETGYLNLSRILLPIEESTDARRSLVCATILAELLGDQTVEIELFHVGGRPLPSLKRPEGEAWTWVETRREGAVVEEIVSAAGRADLVVMPMKARQGFRRLLHRSVTERVLREADCPVLVLPEG